LTAALTDNNNEPQTLRKSDNNASGSESTPSNSSIEHKSPSTPWAIECFVDELFLGLVQVKETVHIEGKEIHVRKYQRQARNLFKWIPIARPSPAFIIYISDLTPELKDQLKELISKSPDNLPYVLTEAVGRIFENLDFDYYHISIARNLKVRLEK